MRPPEYVECRRHYTRIGDRHDLMPQRFFLLIDMTPAFNHMLFSAIAHHLFPNHKSRRGLRRWHFIAAQARL